MKGYFNTKLLLSLFIWDRLPVSQMDFKYRLAFPWANSGSEKW